MFEHRAQPLLSPRQFLLRLVQSTGLSLALVAGSLLMGMVGYRLLEGLSWIDAFLNAAMLLGGMGPVGDIPTASGKIFAGLYALYAGLILIAVSAVMLTPVIHRVLHRLHLEDGQGT